LEKKFGVDKITCIFAALLKNHEGRQAPDKRSNIMETQ